jgi:hypothetical protein
MAVFGQVSRIRHLEKGDIGVGGERFRVRQPNDGRDVSDGAIGIHVRVIVYAEEFVTIATALPSFFARNARLAANAKFLRSGRDFVDCVGVCGVGFVGCRGAGGLRRLYGDVWDVSDACPAGGGGS